MSKTKIPKELDKIIKEVNSLGQELIKEESKIIPITEREGYWDFPLSVEIQFFDPLYSYEITGYKPINETKGLDFLDREKAKHEAKKNAERIYDEKYS